MSLALTQSLQIRIAAQVQVGGSALAAWAATYKQTPQVLIGYRKPTGAEGWPFIALEPATDTRDLRKGTGTGGGVAMAIGVRLGQVERGDLVGVIACHALAEAVLEAIGRPARYYAHGMYWDASGAELVDALYQHPTYESEWRINFTRAGVAGG